MKRMQKELKVKSPNVPSKDVSDFFDSKQLKQQSV